MRAQVSPLSAKQLWRATGWGLSQRMLGHVCAAFTATCLLSPAPRGPSSPSSIHPRSGPGHLSCCRRLREREVEGGNLLLLMRFSHYLVSATSWLCPLKEKVRKEPSFSLLSTFFKKKDFLYFCTRVHEGERAQG